MRYYHGVRLVVTHPAGFSKTSALSTAASDASFEVASAFFLLLSAGVRAAGSQILYLHQRLLTKRPVLMSLYLPRSSAKSKPSEAETLVD